MPDNQELTSKIDYLLRRARVAVDSIKRTKRRSRNREDTVSKLREAIADVRALSSHPSPVLAGHIKTVARSADRLASACGAAPRSVFLDGAVVEANDLLDRQCVALWDTLQPPPPSTAAEALEKLSRDCKIAITWFTSAKERHEAVRWKCQFHDEHELERRWYEDGPGYLRRRAGEIADALIDDGLSPPDVPLPNHPTPLRALQNWIRSVRNELATRKGESGQTGKLRSAGSGVGERTTDAEPGDQLADPSKTKRKRAGGRPPLSDREARERKQLVERWNRAMAEGVRQKDFCADQGISLKHLTKCINWLAQRRRRNNKP